MNELASLENRLHTALDRIDGALKTDRVSDDSDAIIAENAALKAQLQDLREERRKDLAVIDQLMNKFSAVLEDQNA